MDIRGQPPQTAQDGAAGPGLPSIEWTPDSTTLKEIVCLLRESQSSDSAVQARIAQATMQLRELQNVECYLCKILVEMNSEEAYVRQTAGLLLKSVVQSMTAEASAGDESSLSLPLAYLRRGVVQALGDQQPEVRKTAAIVLSSMLRRFGPLPFVQVFEVLYRNLGSGEESPLVLASLYAIGNIVEDALENQTITDVFVQFSDEKLLPWLFERIEQNAATEVSLKALNILNDYAYHYQFAADQKFAKFFPAYWQALGRMAVVSADKAKESVVYGMIQVLEWAPYVVEEHSSAVLTFVLECTQPSTDYELRKEALNFWIAFTKYRTPASQEAWLMILPTIVPLLFHNSRYDAADLRQMDQSHVEPDNDADYQQPDLPSDIAPMGYDRGDDAAAGDDEGEDVGVSAWGQQWTVRKGAAFTLDNLATAFGGKVLEHALPLIEEGLSSGDWLRKEVSILTIGAIAHGCSTELEHLLPKIIDMLTSKMVDEPRPIIRSISVWCLSRFTPFYSRGDPAYFLKALDKVLIHTVDRNKRVQEAACSALAVLIEEMKSKLKPYLEHVVRTLGRAFEMYQTRNFFVLFDAISTLAEECKSALLAEGLGFSERIVEPLLRRFLMATEKQKLTVALFESVSCLIVNRCIDMKTYSNAIFNKLGQWIEVALRDAVESGWTDKDAIDVLECAIDNVSVTVDAMKSECVPYLSQTTILQNIGVIAKGDVPGVPGSVTQAVFALIGDLAEAGPEIIADSIPLILPSLISHITQSYFAVANNASWAIGQIAFYANVDLEPWIDPIAAKLLDVINDPKKGNQALVRNACITLGRLAIACPAKVVPHMDAAFTRFCVEMQGAANDKEKANALRGLCQCLGLNQSLITRDLHLLLDTLTSIFHPLCSLGLPPPPPTTGEPPITSLTASSEQQQPFEVPDYSKDYLQLLGQVLQWAKANVPNELHTALTRAAPLTRLVLARQFCIVASE